MEDKKIQQDVVQFLKALLLYKGWSAPNFMLEDTVDTDSDSNSSVSNECTPNLFIKKFRKDQLELWVRVRTEESTVRKLDLSCEVYGADGSLSKGSIDIMQTTRGYSRRFCTWINALWVVDSESKSILSNEFFHEALLSYAIRIFMNNVPMFSRAALVNIDTDKRTLTFQKVLHGKDFDHVIHSMTFLQLKSVIYQTLVGIRLAQHRLEFKHHDLHLGNVMVSPCASSSQIFDTPEGLLSVNVEGYEATIIDFGLSSLSKEQSLIRLDIDLLITGDSQTSSRQSVDTEDLGKSWGNWNPDLKGDTGYDYAMFIESVTEQIILERPLPMEKLNLLSQLQSLIKTSFTSRCRPVTPFMLDWAKVWKIFEA